MQRFKKYLGIVSMEWLSKEYNLIMTLLQTAWNTHSYSTIRLASTAISSSKNTSIRKELEMFRVIVTTDYKNGHTGKELYDFSSLKKATLFIETIHPTIYSTDIFRKYEIFQLRKDEHHQ